MSFPAVVLNLAFPEGNNARRRLALGVAIGIVAWGCSLRRMQGLPEPTHADNETLVREVKRWSQDLSW